MSGHSKWHNIAAKKGVADAKRAKVFTKYAREIAIAIREGGSANPSTNSKLQAVIAKAKSENVPNDNINRVLQKYASGAATENYEHIDYEGYGPQGVAIIVETLTDNRQRTVSDVRHYFDKYGGNMGNTGCVSWQFSRKGIILLDGEDKDEEEAMLAAVEAGADDFEAEDDVFEVTTTVDDLFTVRDALSDAGYTVIQAEEQMIPSSYIKLTNEDDIKNMRKMLDAMEENDDVQNVWHNWEIEEE